ncbi:hypothetical protein A8U91_00245 [Halomonas elongata]|uniref:Uncharacterized protein n=1 Tax=Halomonas elongata TaxID=2746 RepID=A0A1B8P104_HALEL|nr:hypothetical protein A8U91_00245 [Halomonas elongata]
MRLVGRSASHVESGRFIGVLAFELNVTAALADIEAFVGIDVMSSAIDDHAPRSANVDGAEFAAFEEEVCPGLLAQSRGDGHRFLYGLGASDDDAVNVAIYQLELIIDEQLLNQELVTKSLGVESLGVFAMDRLTNLHAASRISGSIKLKCRFKISSR